MIAPSSQRLPQFLLDSSMHLRLLGALFQLESPYRQTAAEAIGVAVLRERAATRVIGESPVVHIAFSLAAVSVA
jgi:hypothetical protein